MYGDNGCECFLVVSALKIAMNLKSIVSITLWTAANGLVGLMPLTPAYAEDEDENEVQPTAGQVIPYACYDRAGNVVFTTINPQETVGWELGCREVQYESNVPNTAPITYFQCFDENGGVAFNTVDADVAKDSDLFCREIGARITTPVPIRPIYYECFNADGTLAFTTSYPQNTYGWKPGCRELQYQDEVVAQQLEVEQFGYECLDTSGNVAFITYDPQEVKRWKIGCREVR